MRRTSLEAFASIQDLLGPLRWKVLRALEQLGSATDEQLIALTGMGASTLRSRRVELVALGFVREAGRGVTRSGRGATTWAAVPRSARVERTLMPEASR